MARLEPGQESKDKVVLERRGEKRSSFTIPVQVSVGENVLTGASARGLSPAGLFVETLHPAQAGDKVAVFFEDISLGSNPIELAGTVMWTSLPPNAGMGITIDTTETSEEMLRRYRAFILRKVSTDRSPPGSKS